MKHSSFRHLLLLVAAVLIPTVGIFAQSTSQEYSTNLLEKSKTFLIISSYNENSPWTKSIITPITYYIASNDDVHAELYHLNSVLITDSLKYNTVKQNFFTKYENTKVDYVACIGQVAFSFRKEIKEKWGDIPILLITRDPYLADTEYYFSDLDYHNKDNELHMLSDLRDEYNFTAIYLPDYYKETIDLMNTMLNQMDELIFFSDVAYYNRYLEKKIRTYMMENYPDVKYEWLKADKNTDLDLQYYLMHHKPKTGLLLSSWFFETLGPLGLPTLVSGDITLLHSSHNPVFSLCQAYMSLGALGGVYASPDDVREAIEDYTEKIVCGTQARDLKFYSRNNVETIINYPLLKDYDMRESSCPADTVYIDKPLTFWQKYLTEMLVAIVVIVIVFFIFARRNIAQRHEIDILQRHKQFVDTMPVPYSKATIKYSPTMEVTNIKYSIHNQAFTELIEENRAKDKTYILFPNTFISQKTNEMLLTAKPVTFSYYFEESKRTYLFTLCIVGSSKKNDLAVTKSIDIFAIDITDRVKNEKRLRELTQQLDLTISVANIIPWEWDLSKDMMYFKSLDLFKRFEIIDSVDPDKYKWSAVPTADFMRMIVQEDKEEMRHMREQVILNNADQVHVEYRIRVPHRGKETLEWFDMNGVVTERDSDGRPTRLIGSLLVVTERKRQENDLVEAKEKANEADEKKTDFLTNMSHEMRTPLNAIVGFASLISETDDPQLRKEYAEHIATNSDILLNLVDDVLDLAQVESNTMSITETATDLNRLTHTVAESMRPHLKKGVELNLINGNPQCCILADGNRISQVLMNLLNNASKFTDKGSITFGYEVEDDVTLHFYVKDSGIGIAPEDQKRLFKRFDKLDDFSTGTGLGLSISKTIVEQMGGKIGMDSEGEGKGATFWFDIPYVKSSTCGLSNDAHSKATARATASSAKSSREASEKPLILIAEDIEGNYMLLKSFLGKNYELLHAWNGEEAVEMCEKYEPDLILMDIGMPKLDGYGATERIRKSGNRTPIIAVTAYAYASDRKRILESGFNGYVTKPVTRAELYKSIQEYLRVK